MSKEKNKPGEGAIFPNTKKREGKKDPDFTGVMTDERGREFWVSGWKHTKGDLKYMSLAFKPKEAEAAKAKSDDGWD